MSNESDAMALLPVAEPDLGPLEEEYVLAALRSGWVSSIGAFIDRFEKLMADICGTAHCIAVANGTVALHLALATRDIGAGDEVIVPDLTFVATASAVRHAGAEPVLVDVDAKTFCMDPELVEKAITPRTKAIIPVHLMGHPADMDALSSIARKYGLFVIEDAAEAHGARWRGRRVGALGDAGCFSFYGNKLVTTGEGGCITTDDSAYAAKLRFLKDHAMSHERRYYHPVVGYNYRMTNLQAALGCAQLERLDEILERRKAVLSGYRSALAGTGFELNPQGDGADPVCWLVLAFLPGSWSADRQARLLLELRDRHRVDARPLFVPMHQLPPYQSCRFLHRGSPVSDDVSVRGLCLPSSSRLSRTQIEHVAASLQKAVVAVDERGAR